MGTALGARHLGAELLRAEPLGSTTLSSLDSDDGTVARRERLWRPRLVWPNGCSARRHACRTVCLCPALGTKVNSRGSWQLVLV